MKKVLVLMLAMLLLTGTALAEVYAVGDTAEDYTLHMMDGTTTTLSTLLEDKCAVLLNFWYADCRWCDYEMPFLDTFAREYADSVAVVTVNSTDDVEKIQSKWKEFNTSMPVCLDDGTITKAFVEFGFPTTAVIAPDLTVTVTAPGAVDDPAAFTDMVAEQLKGTEREIKPQSVNADYCFRVADEAGEPVPGATLYICGDTLCRALQTDANGEVRMHGMRYPYDVHILAVPEGYTFDREAGYNTGMEDTELTITVSKQ